MCSLLDQMSELKETQPEPKDTQPGSIQPYSAGPAELSVPEPVVEVSCILMSSGLHIVWHTAAAVALLGEHDAYSYSQFTS